MKAVVTALLSLLACASLYGSVVFVSFEPNVTAWGVEGRGYFALACSGLAWLIVGRRHFV